MKSPSLQLFSRSCAAVLLGAALSGSALLDTGTMRAQAPSPTAPAALPKEDLKWTAAGWGGGGFYYAAAFHPTKAGTFYLAGDVGGVYKTTDNGATWRMINKGIADYGVFTLAVDPSAPDTLYAATEDGLCKSTNAGEEWQVIPHTGRKELRITGEKGKSIRNLAVDPSDSNVVYAGSPGGKLYKSTDGGQSWKVSYAKDVSSGAGESTGPALTRVQFGKVNSAFFGGWWAPVVFPTSIAAADATGFGFAFKGDGSEVQDSFLVLRTSTGAIYRSRNLREIYKSTDGQEVILRAADFAIDPDLAKKQPEKAQTFPATPDWSTVNRFDFAVSGPLPENSTVARFGKFFFAATKTSDGKTGTAEKPVLVGVLDMNDKKPVASYGNIRFGDPVGGPIFTVAVSAKNTSQVAAATADSGIILSTSKGDTWTALKTPSKASCVAWDPQDPNTLYATFFTDGAMKSTDLGKTWTSISAGLPPKLGLKDIAVSPANPKDIVIIGSIGWNGATYVSNDGGATWTSRTMLTKDLVGDPTLPEEGKDGGTSCGVSNPTNVVINPNNPQQIYISANWRPCLSEDGGQTWRESVAGADISCITDVRFHKGKVYVTAMDEGTLVSENNGKTWKQLWPLKWIDSLSGHNWRVAVVDDGGAAPRVISTASPWNHASFPNKVVVSEDGGKSYKATQTGLPNYVPAANTMWGQGYARALAVDPKNPKIVYMGIDGDPTPGNPAQSGGGVFKSEDGGNNWKQLAAQPGSRRMYFGLAVDPTNSKRVFWGSCGDNGGVHVSEDGGETWKRTFSTDAWIWNIEVTADGTVYAGGKELYRSTDHGATWKAISRFNNGRAVVGIATHPKDPNTIWISNTVWSGQSAGGIYKTTDGGATWTDIAGDIPFVRPMVLRYNAEAGELWAAGVGLFRVKQ